MNPIPEGICGEYVLDHDGAEMAAMAGDAGHRYHLMAWPAVDA